MTGGGFTANPDDLRTGAADLREAAAIDGYAIGLINSGTGAAAAFGLSANASQLAQNWNSALAARAAETTTLQQQSTELANGLDADAAAYDRSDQSNRDRFRRIGGVGGGMTGSGGAAVETAVPNMLDPGPGQGSPGTGASPEHTFTQPGLAQAAKSPSITTLQAAAAKVGAMDPVTSLSWMDCAPVQIDGYATPVGDGGNQVDQAHQDFTTGRQTAERSWTGQAEVNFDQQATVLDGYYSTVRANIANTSDAGAEIAGQLDSWANDTANQAEAIAGAVAEDCQIVLQLGPADPEYPEAADNVHLACADIAEDVTRHTNMIVELNQLMIRLTTPAPYPAHGRMGQAR